MWLKGADRLTADIGFQTQNRLSLKRPNHVIIHGNDLLILMSGIHWNHNVALESRLWSIMLLWTKGCLSWQIPSTQKRDDHESISFRAQQECGWVYSPQDRATGQLCDPLGPRGQRQSERNQSGLSRPPSGCMQTASLPVSWIIANPLANMSLGGDTVWVAPS